VDNILTRGAGGPEFVPVSPVRLINIRLFLTSPSLARWRRLLYKMYNVMWCPACLPCRAVNVYPFTRLTDRW